MNNRRKLPRVTKQCPVCEKEFETFEDHHPKSKTTCSIACSNTYFRSGRNHPNWKEDSYRTTCFLHHERLCVVCGEHRVVEVHHLDENRENNDPTNLVPLCPTHHRYWHSKYKPLIESIVLSYVAEFKLAYEG